MKSNERIDAEAGEPGNIWTSVNLRIPTANKVRDIAHARRKSKHPAATTREVADELVRLGIDAMRKTQARPIRGGRGGKRNEIEMEGAI